MTQRHKHADVIIAWAEGCAIEYRINQKYPWEETDNPGWYKNYEYRVKPPARKYRVALVKGADYYTTTADTETDAAFISCSAGFVRWLTDWIEYEG